MFGQTNFRKFVKAAIVGEVVLCLGAYRVWHQMNTSRGTGNACNIWKALVNTQNSEKLWQSSLHGRPQYSLTGWLWKLMNFVASPCYGENEMLPFLTKNLLSQRNPQCTSHLKPLPTTLPPPPPHTHTHTHTSLLADDWCIHFYASESMSLGLKWMVNPSWLYMSPHTVLHMSTSGYCDICKAPNEGFKWVSEPP